jgi:predicted O-methyltransferase YrrM
MTPIEAISKHFATSMRRMEADNMPILVRRGDRNTLAACLADLRFNRGVEIGTQRGHYAMRLCKANPNLNLTCIDPWLPIGTMKKDIQNKLFEKSSRNLKNLNVTIKRVPSLQALKDFEDNSLDFVFIDGAHDFDNVVCDLVFWAYKVKRGGIIALHDYIASHNSGVMKAIDAYTHCHSIRPWFVTREQLTTAFWVNDDDMKIRNYTTLLRPKID